MNRCWKWDDLRSLGTAFWNDEQGIVWTMELILAATILALGSIVGLTAFRDSVVQEFGDMAAASAELDQSYEYNRVADSGSFGTVNFRYSVAGSTYTDLSNAGEPTPTDPAGAAPMCIVFGGTSDEN